MKAHIFISAFALAALTLTACDDYLEVSPNDRIILDDFYTTEEECESSVQALYTRVWFEFNDKFYFAMGDGRGGNLLAPYSDYIYPFSDLTETGLTGPLVSAWGSFYVVASQSSRIINSIKEASIDEDIKNQYVAEARFMRGVAYYYLGALWGNVVVYEDPDALVNTPTQAPTVREDVFEFAIRDFEYAAMYLPEKSPASGRVNKYSAYGFLSRLYLTAAFLSDDANSGSADSELLELAKKAAQKVIDDGPFALLDTYSDLFEVDNDNNEETVFALQWIDGSTTWGYYNSHQAYLAYGSDITNDDASWGSYTYAYPECILEFLEEDNENRRYYTWMAEGDYYETIDIANGGFTCDNGTSRINAKKGVTGSSKDNSAIARMNSGLNSYMMRYAEVLLNYCEATLGTDDECTDATALEYLNQVRTRAGVKSLTSFTWDDLRHENRMEFTLEGKYWYDLMRRALYKQQEIINYIVSQDRGTLTPYVWDSTTQTYTVNEDATASARAIGSIDESIFLLPYPETEVIQNPGLNYDPVEYDFSEDRLTDQLFE